MEGSAGFRPRYRGQDKGIGMGGGALSWGRGPQNQDHTCVYCGRGGAFDSPSDYGLHLSDADAFGSAYCCSLCNAMVTMPNRALKSALERLAAGDAASAAAKLDEAMRQLQDVRDGLLSEAYGAQAQPRSGSGTFSSDPPHIPGQRNGRRGRAVERYAVWAREEGDRI